MKKNIAYIISSLEYGGAEKQIVADSNIAISSNEFNSVHVLFLNSGPLLALINKNICTINIKSKSYIQTIYKIAKYTIENNIYIVHSSSFSTMVSVAIASIFIPVKVLWHFHGHDYKLPILSKLALKWLGRFPNVKRIIFVCNEQMKHHSFFMKFPKNKTIVLLNHSELVVSNKNIKESHSVSIGYLGRVVELKRLNILVNLATYLLNINYYKFVIEIVGDGPALNDLKENARSNGVDKYFFFHGFQSDTINYYSKFDLFVNTSSEECLSVAMVDAAICSLPIVAFDVGGNSEIVLSEKTGYIVNNQDEFNVRCFELIKDESLRNAMGIQASEYAKDQFGLEKHAKELLKLYQKVLTET